MLSEREVGVPITSGPFAPAGMPKLSTAALDVPLLLMLGRHDVNVSSEVAAEWFAQVRAPSKTLVWFGRSGHHITSEEPGKLLTTLVTKARPIAEQAGDVPP